MKVKDIVYEDGPIAGQPQTGKVSKVQPGVGGAPGMVSITKPDGSILTVPTNQITTGIDGKMSVNTQQGQPGQDNATPTAPAPTSNGQPNITMGQDLQMAEEPVARQIPKVSIANPLQPMVMDNGNIKGTPLQPANGDITPELIARSAPDFEERYIEANGKKYLALATGTVFKVSPRDFAEITGLYHLPGNTNQKLPPLQNLPGQLRQGPPSFKGAQHLEESAEVARIKLLSGL
jgi:hypothetical protein